MILLHRGVASVARRQPVRCSSLASIASAKGVAKVDAVGCLSSYRVDTVPQPRKVR